MPSFSAAHGNPSLDSQVPDKNSSGRGVEIFLLGAATLITGWALAIVLLSQEQSLSLDLLWYMGAFLGLFAIAHVAVRFLAPFADPVILPCVSVLNGLGLVLIYRLDLAAQRQANAAGEEAPAFDASKQVLWTFIGIAVFVLVLFFLKDHRILSRYAYTLGFVGIVFLTLPALLPSRWSEVNGAKNWILLPGFSIQPGEFSKILLLVFFAAVLVSKRELFTTAGSRVLGMDLPRARDLGPILLAWLLSLGVLVFETDLGLSLLLFASVLTMIYVATERVSWVVIGVILFSVGATTAYFVFSHVRVRVQTWKDPLAYYTEGGYQLSQALFGMSTGGLFGTGLGNGRPQQVPFANTDFMISTIAEELGLIGLTAVLLLFAIIIVRGIRVGLTVRDSFGKLIATGLAFTMAIQIFVVVGGVSALIPLTGLTTPFVSYGGSSLLANYALIAILLRISHHARTPIPTVRQSPAIADAQTGLIRRTAR